MPMGSRFNVTDCHVLLITVQILLDEMTKKKCVENGALLLVVRILKIDSFVEFKPNGDDW